MSLAASFGEGGGLRRVERGSQSIQETREKRITASKKKYENHADVDDSNGAAALWRWNRRQTQEKDAGGGDQLNESPEKAQAEKIKAHRSGKGAASLETGADPARRAQNHGSAPRGRRSPKPGAPWSKTQTKIGPPRKTQVAASPRSVFASAAPPEGFRRGGSGQTISG